MPDEQGVIRRIAWRELCPWLIVFRTFRLSISLPILLLASVGALVTPLGWRVGEFLFIGRAPGDAAFAAVLEANGRWPDAVGDAELIYDTDRGYSAAAVPRGFTNLAAVYRRFTEPFWRLAARDTSLLTRLSRAAYLLFGALWNIAVWALLAAAITRIAAVYLGREERVSLKDAIRHAARNYAWYFVAPLFPLSGVLLVAVGLALLGLLMRLSLGVLVGGILWLLVLLGSLVMAVLLLGLMFGWPLMWPAISSEEGGDAFEAFSRSYSYTFQRPLHYLAFALLAVLLGGLGWLLVSHFAAALIELPLWAASWGAGSARIELITSGSSSGMLWVGSGLIRLFSNLVLTVAAGFNYSFFFCAATAIYLLLRREYDQTELDEVFVAEEEDQYGLPPLEPEQTTAADSAETPGAPAPDEAEDESSQESRV